MASWELPTVPSPGPRSCWRSQSEFVHPRWTRRGLGQRGVGLKKPCGTLFCCGSFLGPTGQNSRSRPCCTLFLVRFFSEPDRQLPSEWHRAVAKVGATRRTSRRQQDLSIIVRRHRFVVVVFLEPSSDGVVSKPVLVPNQGSYHACGNGRLGVRCETLKSRWPPPVKAGCLGPRCG